MELGAVRVRKYDLLDEHRDTLLRGMVGVRPSWIKRGCSNRKWDRLGSGNVVHPRPRGGF